MATSPKKLYFVYPGLPPDVAGPASAHDVARWAREFELEHRRAMMRLQEELDALAARIAALEGP